MSEHLVLGAITRRAWFEAALMRDAGIGGEHGVLLSTVE
jgi:hypothetical protein